MSLPLHAKDVPAEAHPIDFHITPFQNLPAHAQPTFQNPTAPTLTLLHPFHPQQVAPSLLPSTIFFPCTKLCARKCLA